jgi:hypothetical protein
MKRNPLTIGNFSFPVSVFFSLFRQAMKILKKYEDWRRQEAQTGSESNRNQRFLQVRAIFAF